MAEEYPLGQNRIFYRSTSFREGLQIIVDLLCPNLDNHKGIELVELGEGIYYFDFDFTHEGVWVGVFFEDSVKRTSQNFRIKRKISYLRGGFIIISPDQIINR